MIVKQPFLMSKNLHSVNNSWFYSNCIVRIYPLKMGNYTIFGGSKILGEARKQQILQQMFRKF